MELLDKKQNPEFREYLKLRGTYVEVEDFDFARFSHLGFPCIIRRVEKLGNWCGYVGVGKDHPFFKMDYNNKALADINVHGGLTYARPCMDDENLGVCHPNDGDDERFWFGFDCAHFQDLIPIRTFLDLEPDSSRIYRSANFVVDECKDLAEQFYEAKV